MMRNKKAIVWSVAIIATLVMLSGTVNAQTLTFSMSATSGDVITGSVDIIKIGAYTQSNYQYFYVDFRDTGIAQPTPSQKSTILEVIVDAMEHGDEITEYLEITLTWYNNNGNISHTYLYSIKSQSGSMLSDRDVTISGSRVTVRVPTLPLKDVDVTKVEFASTLTSPYTGDTVTYEISSGGGGGNSGNSGDNENNNPGESITIYDYLFRGGIVFCLLLPLIIDILLAVWAYKDAQKRNMDNPIIWFLIVFFLGLIGLIIYLVVRPKEPVQQNQYYAPPPPPQ